MLEPTPDQKTEATMFRNRVIDKKQLRKLISWSFTHFGTARTADLADKLKDLGFRYATQAGLSISVEDLKIPPVKRQLLDSAEEKIRSTETRYSRGEITEVERFQKVIDTWNGASEALKNAVVDNFKASDPLNSVYMMAFSGARGNISQVRQLVGMRGLMADPQGEIIDLPIKTNFREGLTVTEYVISSYGARKGLVDTALRTADSGYLTRRLVDVSQDVIVRDVDCGTQRCLPLQSMTDGDRVLIPLKDRMLGRTLGADVVHPKTGEVIANRNQDISPDLAQIIVDAGVQEVKVRSALTCEANRSVCQRCYGWSLAHGDMVDLGEAVGIIAAQSIGEPGTQLTMRTFHTGGVFTGEMAQQVKAASNGEIHFSKQLRTRAYRTRHGESASVLDGNGDLELVASNCRETIPLTQGTILFVRDRDKVHQGDVLAEIPLTGRTRKSLEKASKNVASDLAGSVRFADIPVEEKTDRQGNTTRIAQRGGLIWVLSGDVYNLPPGAETVVKNGMTVAAGDVLAETKLVTEHGGIVRLPQSGSEGKGVREVEIVTASVLLDQAKVLTEGGQHPVIETRQNQRFSLKATPGTKIIHNQVVAELIDDHYHTQTGGILKYAGVEVMRRGKAKQGQGYEVTRGGTLLWIPEEAHEINKDISLLLVEDGQYVDAGTEVVKDIFCQSAGVIEVTQKNDILREIVVKPGDLHMVDDPNGILAKNGTLIQPGEEVMSGLVVESLRYLEYLETPEGSAMLLRPVIEFEVPDVPTTPSQESINEAGRSIRLRAVQRIPYKDGERVRSIEGVALVRTQLVLELNNDTPQLAADIELIPDDLDPDVKRLQLVILESLIIRRDTVADATQGDTQTRLLVQDGDFIKSGAVVARTAILCKTAGEVQGIKAGLEAVRRILVVTGGDRMVVETQVPATDIAVGDLLVAGTEIVPGQSLEESGQVLEIEAGQVMLRLARPYRVSPGAVLHVSDEDLVQRGDQLVLLVFERTKTGDIIQGLPRIEELLEARRPKEACILASRSGTAQVVYASNETVEVKVVEDNGVIADYPIRLGQSVMVSDGQQVEAAEPLTDGPSNPHEILETYFHLYQETQGMYKAALMSLQRVQNFLVNEVQSVYQSQGIDIADKHIEVIVRQMTSKVRINDGGDTTMLPGELVELRQVEQVNEAMAITGGAPAEYNPVLLGITKASLNTDSFISAASFQETTRVLTEAAIEGKSDWLRGLKENVIIGRLIPAGTGFNAYEESGGDFDLSFDKGVSEDDLSSVVLDDITARSYGLEANFANRASYDPESQMSLSDDDQLIDDAGPVGGFQGYQLESESF